MELVKPGITITRYMHIDDVDVLTDEELFMMYLKGYFDATYMHLTYVTQGDVDDYIFSQMARISETITNFGPKATWSARGSFDAFLPEGFDIIKTDES